MILSKLKLYLYGALGVLLAILVAAVKILSARNSRLSRKLETAEASVEHQRAVILADTKADKRADERLRETTNEIDDTGSSSVFLDPNRLRDDDTE